MNSNGLRVLIILNLISLFLIITRQYRIYHNNYTINKIKSYSSKEYIITLKKKYISSCCIYFKDDKWYKIYSNDFYDELKIGEQYTIINTSYSLSDDKEEHIYNCFIFIFNLKFDHPTIIFDDITKYNYIIEINKDGFVEFKDIERIIKTYVKEEYIEELLEKFNNLFFDVIDIKTGKKYSNYI
jgi:hypothetical protein